MSAKAVFIEELNEELKKVWAQAGFKEPTAVQLKAFGPVMEGADCIVESPTGTGKTLAYVLPVLNKINPAEQKVQAVFVAPSRELVMQIFEVVQAWAKSSGITAASFIGGANPKR